MVEHLEELTQRFHQAIDAKDAARVVELSENLHHFDLALIYEDLDEGEREFFLETLGPERFREVLPELADSLVEEALEYFPAQEQREILEGIPDDDRVDVLQDVSEEKRDQYLNLLEEEHSSHTRQLLEYGEETAAGRMTTQIGRVGAAMSVREAVESLQGELDDIPTLSRIFVVDERGHLEGQIRLRDLAFNAWSRPISELMEKVEHQVRPETDQEAAAGILSHYDLIALPVVDEQGRLLGAITHDDAMEILEEESTEDFEKQAGLLGETPEESYLNIALLSHFKRRAGWLLGLAVLAVASGYVMHAFEHVLSEAYVLSLFLPMVIAAGGNTGGQASMMVIRAMALGEVDLADVGRVVWKELCIGLMLGFFLGLTISMLIFFILPVLGVSLPEGVGFGRFAALVACAMTGQVVTSALIGALLPIVARALRLDPAVIAAPAVTTVVDVTGMLIYFSVARGLLGL